MPYVENPILFETRIEQVAREIIEEDEPIMDTVPSCDYFGYRITKGDEYMIIGSHHVLIENLADYCEKVLGFEWCIKK